MKVLAHSDAVGVSIPGELVARLEAASVGSRELDGLLSRHFGWHRVEPRHARNKHGGWIAPEDFMGVNGDGSPRLDGLHGTSIYRDPPRLSQSLDAALALAERVLDDANWSVCRLEGGNSLAKNGRFYAVADWDDEWAPSFDGNAPTPALALCIAILKATTPASESAVGTKAKPECAQTHGDSQ
jgi:hypothetical protein